MNRLFDVDIIMICDYASQDNSGRGLFAGVFPGMIGFEKKPEVWPQYYIVVSLVPLASIFSFSINFSDEKRETIVNLNAEYKNFSKPDTKERVMFVAQIPPVKFSGAGVHELSVLQGKKIIESRRFPVEVGSMLPIELGEVELKNVYKRGD